MEERPRVKIVDYTGSTKVERTKVDEKMKELGIQLRLDSFLDQSVVKRVQGIVRDLMAEKGYEFAEVTPTVEPLPAGAKLVKVVFDVKEGPQVKVRSINFDGNVAVSDRALGRQMKGTKAHGFLSWMTGKGKYQEAKFEEDAEKIVEYYRNKGYIAARVGQPEIKVLEDSADKETRWVELNVPIDEGAALQRRRVHLRRQQGHQDRVPGAAFQDQEGRLVFRQADSQRPDQGARSCTAAAATSNSPDSRTSSRSTRPRARWRVRPRRPST